jgi:predicted solute-binding protein
MLHGAQRDLFELDFRTPAECADRLAAGAADIGIVPSIELRRQDLEIIRGVGIACRGPVRSILLVSKTDPARIRTLATDSSSRTSVMLARILLARRYGAEPLCIAHPPDLSRMLATADAALIIGDPALYLDPGSLPYRVLDLGEEWTVMTGLPMVFAVWAGHGPFAPDLAPAFVESCRFGLAHLDDIVAAEAGTRNLSQCFIRDYLTRHLTLELGPGEYRGLETFLRYSAEFVDSEKERTV